MYAPVATPHATMPPIRQAHLAGSASTGGRTSSVTFIATPTRIALETVPIPGRCRSGIHRRRTATPTMIVQVPTARSV